MESFSRAPVIEAAGDIESIEITTAGISGVELHFVDETPQGVETVERPDIHHEQLPADEAEANRKEFDGIIEKSYSIDPAEGRYENEIFDGCSCRAKNCGGCQPDQVKPIRIPGG